MARSCSVWLPWTGAAASRTASCTVVAALTAASLIGCGSGAATAPGTTPASVSATRANPVAACGEPSTAFARFWAITAEPVPGLYEGTVRVGSEHVPAMSMYVSGGLPGTGTLCVTARAGSHNPVQSTAAPRPGAIAYVGTAQQNMLYFATRPGVTQVTASGRGPVVTYSDKLKPTDPAQLQPLGRGWHAVSTGVGLTGTPLTLRAFNAAGELVDTVTEPYTAAQPTPSQP